MFLTRAIRILVATAVAFPALVSAADYFYRPVSVSFFPPLTTNGREAGRTSSQFSFNIIGGYIGEVRGAELGSVFNLVQDNFQGAQFGGAINAVGGNFTGFQASGAVNIVGGDLTPVQASGAVNLVLGTVKGVQLGAVNITSRLQGAQFAAVNIADRAIGAQFAAVNITRAMKGFQVAAVNLSDGFEGFQLGTVNIAQQAKGFQLGVVNIADAMDGEALGVVSAVGNGRHSLCLWADETALLNLGVKLGSKSIYNVFALGMHVLDSRLYAGYGLGGQMRQEPFFMDVDVTGYSVLENFEEWRGQPLDFLGKLRLAAGWQVFPKMAIVAGPTLNVFTSMVQDGRGVPYYDLTLFQFHTGNFWLRAWPGFLVGVQGF